MSASSIVLVAALWLAVGVLVSRQLRNRGIVGATIVAAVPCWPLYAPLLMDARPASTLTPGPLHMRIEEAFLRLDVALREGAIRPPTDLAALRETLRRCDSRLGRVDRILADEVDPTVTQPLRLARERTCAHVEGVLRELTRLRVQIGLATLVDEGTQVELRLGELAARGAAMEEVAGLSLSAAIVPSRASRGGRR